MKKTLIKSLITVLAISSYSIALAHEGEVEPKLAQVRQNTASTTKAVREEVKSNMLSRIDSRYNRMLSRYEATINRLTLIMNKINTRIEKIEALGGNTTEAEKLVLSAKTQIDKAKVSLATLKTLAETQTSVEASSTTIKSIRDGLSNMRKVGFEIEKSLRTAHVNLQKSIGNLRGVSQLHNASSTREN